MNILVVDDDQTTRNLITMILNKGGFVHVMMAESAVKAYEILGIEPEKSGAFLPDLIIMDIIMPEIDGIEACARIKRDKRFAETKMLMASTLSDLDHLKKALLAGASDYITKPFHTEDLLTRVRFIGRKL